MSLELAAAGTPMLIAYDVGWISRFILRRMLRVDTLTLVNLVTETRVVPELLGAECRAERIAPRRWRFSGIPARSRGDAADDGASGTGRRGARACARRAPCWTGWA